MHDVEDLQELVSPKFSYVEKMSKCLNTAFKTSLTTRRQMETDRQGSSRSNRRERHERDTGAIWSQEAVEEGRQWMYSVKDASSHRLPKKMLKLLSMNL